MEIKGKIKEPNSRAREERCEMYRFKQVWVPTLLRTSSYDCLRLWGQVIVVITASVSSPAHTGYGPGPSIAIKENSSMKINVRYHCNVRRKKTVG